MNIAKNGFSLLAAMALLPSVVVRAADFAVEQRLTIPIIEASGLGWHVDAQGQRHLVVVGDRTSHLAIDKTGRLLNDGFETRPLVPAAAGLSGEASTALTDNFQFEAIVGDGSGALFLLQEHSSRIFVTNSSASEFQLDIELVIPAGSEFAEEWVRDSNSQGEGLVLLKNGHVLVLKEKSPRRLVEFAPQGEAAAGYEAGMAVGNAQFPIPAARKLIAVMAWKFTDAAKSQAKDLSDMTVADDGRIYVVSYQSGVICALKAKLQTAAPEIGFKRCWKLPSAITKAEGLAIDSRRRPIIVSDTAGPKSLFILSALPAL